MENRMSLVVVDFDSKNGECYMKSTKKPVRSKRIITWDLFLTLVLTLLLTSNPLTITPCEAVTENEIRDAILNRTGVDLNTMDLNEDDKVDVADVVNFHHLYCIANFTEAESEINETAGTYNVVLNFTQPITGTVKYTVGGTATEDEDYVALPGSVAVDGSSATIEVSVMSDTIFEGDEIIKIALLPSEEYLLGTERTHSIKIKDNPFESSTDYIFILSSKTLGVEGDTTDQQGFPPTLFSRTATVNITFSQNNVLDAVLNVAKSIGITDTVTGADTIPSTLASYSSGILEMVFEYNTQSEGFVSDSSITGFSSDNPSLGVQTKKTLANTLTLRINDFDISTDKFTDKYLQGAFSLSMSGVLNEGTVPFFQGSLVGTMQQ